MWEWPKDEWEGELKDAVLICELIQQQYNSGIVAMTLFSLLPSFLLTVAQAGKVFEKQSGDFMKDVISTGELVLVPAHCSLILLP